jgi:hypothetical protein
MEISQEQDIAELAKVWMFILGELTRVGCTVSGSVSISCGPVAALGKLGEPAKLLKTPYTCIPPWLI